MDRPGTGLIRRASDVPGALGVDRRCRLGVRLGSVHVGPPGTVENDVGRRRPHGTSHLRYIGDVELGVAQSHAVVARGGGSVGQRIEECGNRDVQLLRADLASRDEVRGLADQLIAEHSALHGLVNNAGIGTALPGDGERMESSDGYELRFAVNYLAGY